MSHTPEQARTLWCPMVRTARREVEAEAAIIDRPGGTTHIHERVQIVGGCNTDALGRLRIPASCHCIADQCAMWRWEFTTASVPTTTEGASGMLARVFEQKTVRTHGYCGIAGRPEVLA